MEISNLFALFISKFSMALMKNHQTVMFHIETHKDIHLKTKDQLNYYNPFQEQYQEPYSEEFQ